MLKLEVSTRGLIIIALLLIGLWALTELWPVILLLTVALILTIGLLPYVDALVVKGLPRAAAVLVVMFAILLVIGGMFSLMVPALIDEVQSVKDNLPDSARELEELMATFGIDVELQERARNIDWNNLLSGRAAVDAGQQVLSTTLALVTIFVLTAYLLGDMPRLGSFIDQFIPDDRKGEADKLFHSVSHVVGGYLRGQAITSLAIAVFTFVVLRLVGVPNALAFAVLAGFADIIPLIGALIAVIPPVAAALQESSTQAIIVLAALLAYQQFEDRFLGPRVYGRTLNLPPLIVLIAVLAGAELLGITGVLLALPLAAAGRVAVDYIIENRRLPLTQPVETEEEPMSHDQPFAPDVETSEADAADHSDHTGDGYGPPDEAKPAESRQS